MIEKINQLLKIKQTIDDLNKKMDEETVQFSKLAQQNIELANSVHGLHRDINEIKSNNEHYLNALRSALEEISGLKAELQKEISDFKVMRTRLNNEIVNSLANEFQQE